MAIGWLTAFKAIPWADVIAAAPAVARGARKLVDAMRKRGGDGEAADEPPVQVSGDPDARVSALEARVSLLQSQQREALALVESLAGQQEKLVAAVDVLRVRTRVLLILAVILAVVVLLLARRLL